MKVRRVVFAPKSSRDFDWIYGVVANNAGHSVAVAYIRRIEQFCRSLALAAERGHQRDDLLSGLRVVGFEKRVTIAFIVHADTVAIMRVFYGGVNIDDAL